MPYFKRIGAFFQVCFLFFWQLWTSLWASTWNALEWPGSLAGEEAAVFTTAGSFKQRPIPGLGAATIQQCPEIAVVKLIALLVTTHNWKA